MNPARRRLLWFAAAGLYLAVAAVAAATSAWAGVVAALLLAGVTAAVGVRTAASAD